MSFYGNAEATARRLLDKFGMTVTLKRSQSVTGWTQKIDRNTGRVYWEDSLGAIVYSAPTGVPVSYVGKGVVTSYSQNEIDGTHVKQGDRLMVLDASFPEPQTGDVLTLGSTDYKIVAPVQVVNPAGTVIVYKAQVRK